MAQVELLQDLVDRRGQRVSELAASRRLAPSTVSSLVQQMVRAGLVQRQTDSLDRRAVVVQPTAEGVRALRSWSLANETTIDRALRSLRQADRVAITAAMPALALLVDSLEVGAAEQTPTPKPQQGDSDEG